MDRVLVIGASGQLGSAVLERLQEDKAQCVAFVRPSSDFSPMVSAKTQVVYGDLADSSSIHRSLVGVNKVIATASSIIPRQGERFGVNEIRNYRNLIEACKSHNVKHLVYVSAFSTPYDSLVPEFQIKRKIEQLIKESGVSFTIFRAAPFMDIYYAVMGSHLAMEGVSRPTLLRGFWLTSLYAKLTVGLLENRGIALLPGSGNARHAFVCIQDVAAFMVKALAIASAKNRTIELGGPELLSWGNVADIYSELLRRRLKRIPIPSLVLNACRVALRPLSPAGENIMSCLSLLGRHDFAIDMTAISAEFSIRMTDTRQFLLQRICASQHRRPKGAQNHLFHGEECVVQK